MTAPASLFALVLVGLTTAQAAPISDSQKLDSLLVGQTKILQHVADEPLANRTFGLEINIPRLLYPGIGVDFSMTGSVSLFSISRSAEIAIPLYFGKIDDASTEYTLGNKLTIFTADVQYRQFLGRTQNGFYLSGFGRLAYHSGYKSDESILGMGYSTSGVNTPLTQAKFGVGVGLGYRIFSHRGMYWGCGLSLGRYLNGGTERFRGGSFYTEDTPYIIELELLKFGWAF